jgi:HK97 family phage major capsid protein
MNLSLLLAAFRAATTDDARNAAFAGVGYADRHRLSGEVTARIQELYANQNRTADESAEMADLVPIAERLDQMVQQDIETNTRAQAIANRHAPANPSPAAQAVAVRNNPNVPAGPEPTPANRAAWRQGLERADRIFGTDHAITRAIAGDLEAYGLRDAQIDHLASREYADDFIAWMRSCAHNPHGVQGRALNEITQDGGAVFVPADFLAEIIQRRAAQRRVAGMVRRIQTSRDKISIPKHMGGSSTQQSDLGVQWVGAEGTVTEDTGLQENAMVTIQVHRGGFYVVADRALLED